MVVVGGEFGNRREKTRFREYGCPVYKYAHRVEIEGLLHNIVCTEVLALGFPIILRPNFIISLLPKLTSVAPS